MQRTPSQFRAADVAAQLPPLERKGRGAFCAEQVAIGEREHLAQPALVGRNEDDHAGPFSRRKHRVVFVVAVLRHERPGQLAGQPVVLDVPGPAQVFVLEHEEHVPAKAGPHVVHHAVGDVRVGVDARVSRHVRRRARRPACPYRLSAPDRTERADRGIRRLIGGGRFRRVRSRWAWLRRAPPSPDASDPRPARRACAPAPCAGGGCSADPTAYSQNSGNAIVESQ